MTAPLDPGGDPDRYDPAREVRPTGPLDPALDPDRFRPDAQEPQPVPLGRTGGRNSTLPQLIGREGSFEDSPSPYIWILGLIGTLAFLLVVAFVFSHLSP